MTWQVSDTDVQKKAIRRTVLHHALLAYLFGTVIVSVGLFFDCRPHVDLEVPTVFALGIAIGALVVGAVDRVVWPVDSRLGMWRQASLMLRAAAALYRERDPRVVLAPKWSPEWHVHHHLVALVQLRSERVALSGTARFEPEEEALRIAVWTQRLVVVQPNSRPSNWPESRQVARYLK